MPDTPSESPWAAALCAPSWGQVFRRYLTTVSVIKKNDELLLQYREANKLNARIVLVVVRRRRRRRVVGAIVFVIAWHVCELERKRRRARCPDLGPGPGSAVPVPVPVPVPVLVLVVGRRRRGRLVEAVEVVVVVVWGRRGRAVVV